MSKQLPTYNTQGATFLQLLTILFIGLKLGGVIDWSWWAVLAPIWIPFAILFGILAICGVLYFTISVLQAIFGK